MRLLVLIALLLAPASALAVDDPDALAAAAVAAQPGLAALEARTDALRSVAETARLWTDPMIGVELSNLPVTQPIPGAHAMSGLQLKVQQRFPAPGVQRARAASAEARITVSEEQWEVAATALRGQVRGRYEDLALIRRLAALTEQHLAELDGLIASVDARYRVGAGAQHDLLQLALRRDRLAEFRADFDAREAAVLATLNGALARDPASPIATPEGAPLQTLPTDANSRLAAIDQHPTLRVARASAELARTEAEQVRREATPGPSVWLGYRIRAAVPGGDPGINFVTAGLSLPIPVAATRRADGLASAAEARARSAESALDAAQVRLRAQLAAAEARHARASARATAYADRLEPAARAALDSTAAAYQVDRASFAELVRAEVALLDVRRARLLAEAEAASARADVLTLLDHGGAE